MTNSIGQFIADEIAYEMICRHSRHSFMRNAQSARHFIAQDSWGEYCLVYPNGDRNNLQAIGRNHGTGRLEIYVCPSLSY